MYKHIYVSRAEIMPLLIIPVVTHPWSHAKSGLKTLMTSGMNFTAVCLKVTTYNTVWLHTFQIH